AKATSSAHEKKICHIGARNKKKKPNRREQHPKRTADASRDIFEHRKDIGAPALVVVGAGLDRKVGNAKHVLLGLAERNARLEARNHGQETPSLPFLGAGQGERGPNVRRECRVREKVGIYNELLQRDEV